MKNKFLKKSLALLVAATMAVSALPMFAGAAENPVKVVSPTGDNVMGMGKPIAELGSVSYNVNGETVVASGSLKYVTGYTGFNGSNVEEQQGYYLPFKLNIDKTTYADATASLVNTNGTKVPLSDVNEDNVIFLGKSSNIKEKSPKFEVDLDGSGTTHTSKVYTINLSDITAESTTSISKVTPIAESTDIWGKRASDFATGLSFEVSGDKIIAKGELKYVENFTAFNEAVEAQQSGYYLPYQVKAGANVAKVEICVPSEGNTFKPDPANEFITHLGQDKAAAIEKVKAAYIRVTGVNGDTQKYTLDVSGLIIGKEEENPGGEENPGPIDPPAEKPAPETEVKVAPNAPITVAPVVKGVDPAVAETLTLNVAEAKKEEGVGKTAFEAAAANGAVLGFYEIKLMRTLEDGTQVPYVLGEGETLEMSFELGKEYANQKMVIRHYNSETGKHIKDYEVTADENGKVTIEVTELSFFAVQKAAAKSTNPKTGDNAQIFVLLSVLAVAGASVVILRKRQLAK